MGTASRIRQLRKEKGLSQADLAKRIGVSVQAVRLWETEGERGTAPNRSRVEKVAQALGVSVSQIVSPEGNLLPPMREDARVLIERLIRYSARGMLDEDDIDQLRVMLRRIAKANPEKSEVSYERESDWLIGGPSVHEPKKEYGQ